MPRNEPEPRYWLALGKTWKEVPGGQYKSTVQHLFGDAASKYDAGFSIDGYYHGVVTLSGDPPNDDWAAVEIEPFDAGTLDPAGFEPGTFPPNTEDSQDYTIWRAQSAPEKPAGDLTAHIASQLDSIPGIEVVGIVPPADDDDSTGHA